MCLRRLPIRNLIVIGWLLAGCATSESAQGTTAWIDAPLDGLTFPPGQLVTLQGHATGPNGVSRIEIWVNGTLTVEQADPPTEGELAYFDHMLVLDHPGEWLIQLIPFGGDGAAGLSDEIVLYAVAYTPTPTPTDTPEPATATPTPPPTPTMTPPPPDNQGPPAPPPAAPTGDQTLACSAQAQLSWSSVSDRSGIAEYRIQVERHAGDGNWQAVSGSPWRGLGATSLSIPVECGWYYRWRVQAVDGLGNVGGFSSWATFAVTLG